jgi:hypothetical protein
MGGTDRQAGMHASRQAGQQARQPRRQVVARPGSHAVGSGKDAVGVYA